MNPFMSSPIDLSRLPAHDAEERDRLVWALGERIKELTALHGVASLLQDGKKTPALIVEEIVALLPPAWQYPEITAARISFGDIEAVTANFRRTRWAQTAVVSVHETNPVLVEVVYLEEKPPAFEGPFLKEERALIQSVAKMLASFFERKAAGEKLKNAYNNLEKQVRERTEDLQRAHQALREEIAERKRAVEEIRGSQARLRRLSSELALAEERERRAIASDLHDHIGQALTVIRTRFWQMQGNAVFSGMEKDLEETLTLIDQTIQSTRTLTFEISPPVLYDLGLEPALQWLCRQFKKKHGLNAEMTSEGNGPPLPDDVQITVFRSVQELLLNAAKHARASAVSVRLVRQTGLLQVEVKDNGRGFDVFWEETAAADREGFGLYSIRERLKVQGGALEISSSLGQGATFKLVMPLAESQGTRGSS
jgi:signal transduction histidine kinase